MFLHIVLRGISGVGKTTLRNKLVKWFVAHGCQVVVFSKDQIRKEIKRYCGTPYVYSQKQEELCRTLYRTRLQAFFEHPAGSFSNPGARVVIISDCTNTSLKALQDSCFYWPYDLEWYYEALLDDAPVPIQQILIEVGTSLSLCHKHMKDSTGYDLAVQRQRLELEDSASTVRWWCMISRGIPMYNVPSTARPDLDCGFDELALSLYSYFNTNTK